MEEKWIKWCPVDGLEKEYDIIAIYYDFNGFKVVFRPNDPQKKLLHMIFDSGIDCHRETNESFICKPPFESQKKSLGGDWNWTFFKVENSRYLQWLSESSCGISEVLELKHFAFIGTESMLDVATTYEPSFLFIDNDPKLYLPHE